MASSIQWPWIWTNSGWWWRTGKPSVLESMRLQRVRHDRVSKQQQQLTERVESSRRSWRCKGGLRSALLLPSCFSSVQFSRSVVSDSLWPHESAPQASCPSPTPGVYSNSCPSSRWCLPAISSSVIPFSSCPQSLPAWGSFPMSQLFIHMGKKTPSTLNLSFWSVNEQQWQCLLGEGLPAA